MVLPNQQREVGTSVGADEPGPPWPQKVAIIGGGLSGLSMACHLLERAAEQVEITVFEARDHYVHDRTWCTWFPQHHPFEEAVTHRWQQWEVSIGSDRVVRSSLGLPYQRISSGRLYQTALERLEQAGHRVHLGLRGVEVGHTSTGAVVVDANGDTTSADVVFDARPNLPTPEADTGREVDLVQHFVGWHIRSERPAFDPETVKLMEFLPSHDGVRFIYVLPLSAHEALVESTGFSPHPEADTVHHARIQTWLGERAGVKNFEVLDTEQGAIPMSSRSPARRAPGPVQHIGASGGMIKPSSGYSFDAIQRACRVLADQVATGSTVQVPPSQNHLERALDRIFLSFMQRHPERMPAIFLQLFREVRPDRLIRFLSDRAQPADVVAVLRAMPADAMSREALRSIRLWARA